LAAIITGSLGWKKRLATACGCLFACSLHAQEVDKAHLDALPPELAPVYQEAIFPVLDVESSVAGRQDVAFNQLFQPLDLNLASDDELRSLILLTVYQQEQLIAYRRENYPLLSIYELQAVPGWDVETINRLKPLLRLSIAEGKDTRSLKRRLMEAPHQLLFRYGQEMKRQEEYVRHTDAEGRSSATALPKPPEP
jgi:DNA uptake protein ComE-like DNA-binding protein